MLDAYAQRRGVAASFGHTHAHTDTRTLIQQGAARVDTWNMCGVFPVLAVGRVFRCHVRVALSLAILLVVLLVALLYLSRAVLHSPLGCNLVYVR